MDFRIRTPELLARKVRLFCFELFRIYLFL